MATPLRYRVDFSRLVPLLLPALLRRPAQLAWLGALTAPVRQLYGTFLAYAAASAIEVGYNSQTIVLEGALNDQFDPGARRITIDNQTSDPMPLYVNFRSEAALPEVIVLFVRESPPWTYAYGYSEFFTATDFTVRVPASLRTPARTDQLNARIRRFKLPTRHYQLLFV